MISRLLPPTEMFRNISTLVTGSFIAQLVPVVLQGVLRRIYPAEEFGVFAVFVGITGILMVSATLRYEMAVVLPQKQSDAVNMTFAGIFVSLVFSLAMLITILIWHQPILDFLNVEKTYSSMLYFIPPAIFLFSTYQVMNYYLVKYKAYGAIASNKISRRVAEGAGQVALGFAGKLTTGLIVGNMAGHIMNVLAGWWQMGRNGFSVRLFSWKRQWELLVKYREFPMFNLVPAFLNALCLHLPLIFVNKYYTQETTAYFDLARQVLVLPASILTISISQVVLQTITNKNQTGQSIKHDIRKLLLTLSLLGLGMITVTLLWAPPLFAVYAGEGYETSGHFARIIVAGAAIKLIVSPVSSMFFPLGKLRMISLWQTFYFVAIMVLPLFTWLKVETFLMVYLTIDLLAYGILLIMILLQTKSYERNLKARNRPVDISF